MSVGDIWKEKGNCGKSSQETEKILVGLSRDKETVVKCRVQEGSRYLKKGHEKSW